MKPIYNIKPYTTIWLSANLEQYPDRIDWGCLSSNPNAILILEQYPDRINWSLLSSNPNAIHLLKQHPENIDWSRLSSNPNAISLLEQYPDRIHWGRLSRNPNATHLLVQHPDKIDWDILSLNPNAISILEKYPDKIVWRRLSIDAVYDRLRQMNLTHEHVIPKELLGEINQEYQFFLKQKEELKHYIKDNQAKLLNQLEDVKFSQLNRYLSTTFPCNKKVGMFKCILCNFYTSNTLKGMAAHKRGCKKKMEKPAE